MNGMTGTSSEMSQTAGSETQQIRQQQEEQQRLREALVREAFERVLITEMFRMIRRR